MTIRLSLGQALGREDALCKVRTDGYSADRERESE